MAKNVTIDRRQWDKLLKELSKAAEEPHARVGLLDGKGGEETRDGGLTNAQIGGVHEFGSSAAHVPERSFLRRTVYESGREVLLRTAKMVAQRIYANNMPVETGLNILGSVGAAEVKKTITQGEGVPPPNAPATVARKGSSRPLVDTGRMVQSITWDVQMDGEKGEK